MAGVSAGFHYAIICHPAQLRIGPRPELFISRLSTSLANGPRVLGRSGEGVAKLAKSFGYAPRCGVSDMN